MIEIPETTFLRHHIYGGIDDKKARKTIAKLREMHDEDPNSIWEITISSDGGWTIPSVAIYSELHSHSERGGGNHFIVTKVRGQAASGAALIFQAGDFRAMGEMDRILFHEPRLHCDGMMLEEAREFVGQFDDWIDRYINACTARSTMTRFEFRHRIKSKEWVLHLDDGIRHGFVDARG